VYLVLAEQAWWGFELTSADCTGTEVTHLLYSGYFGQEAQLLPNAKGQHDVLSVEIFLTAAQL